jgi:hypothetical protein
MQSSRSLTKGDIHLLISGVFLGAYVLVRMTDPSDYGLTLHPDLDKTWSTWRMVVTAGWLLIALGLATYRKRAALYRSFSYAAATATAVGLIALSILSPQNASLVALLGSLALYAATSGALCLKIDRPIPAAMMGAVFFVLQVLVDGVVHFMNGSFRIH